MNPFVNALKNGVNPSQAMKIAAGFSVFQGLVVAKLLFDAAKPTEVNEKRLAFLHDIVSRNTEHLDEFDIIALRELGLLKEI